MELLRIAQVFFLGIVEAVTEFLPISSTGHLILAGHLLGTSSEFSKVFDIVIQGGAVLAVLVYYRSVFLQALRDIQSTRWHAQNIFVLLALAFIPAATVGFLFHSWIKAVLFSPMTVAWALIVGALLMLWIEKKHPSKQQGPQTITPRMALQIGMFQILALWPGMSRSMVTIVGARISGLSNWQAAEFSFLLAVPTLMGAAMYELWKSRALLRSMNSPWIELGVGTLTAFVVSLLVIHWLLRFLKKHSLVVFAWYRIGLGILILLWMGLR